MTSVIFDPDAGEELLAAIKYYEDSMAGLGKRFRFAVESSIENIIASPFRYRVLSPPFRRLLLCKFPYAIIYSIEPDHIRIMAVAHTSRKPGYWKSRNNDL